MELLKSQSSYSNCVTDLCTGVRVGVHFYKSGGQIVCSVIIIALVCVKKYILIHKKVLS